MVQEFSYLPRHAADSARAPETRNTLLRALAMSSPAHQGVNEPGHENRCSVHVEANHRNMMLLWATPRGRQQVCHNPSFAGGTPSGRMQ
eukprot:6188065-Pleurochrysis_carterae.AAC.3